MWKTKISNEKCNWRNFKTINDEINFPYEL